VTAQCNEDGDELTLTLFKLALAAGKVAHTSAGQSGIITGLLCATPRVTFKWVHVLNCSKWLTTKRILEKSPDLGALYSNGIEILVSND
jgi:hypothetical protein